jgi:hypothetical protein
VQEERLRENLQCLCVPLSDHKKRCEALLRILKAKKGHLLRNTGGITDGGNPWKSHFGCDTSKPMNKSTSVEELVCPHIYSRLKEYYFIDCEFRELAQ